VFKIVYIDIFEILMFYPERREAGIVDYSGDIYSAAELTSFIICKSKSHDPNFAVAMEATVGDQMLVDLLCSMARTDATKRPTTEDVIQETTTNYRPGVFESIMEWLCSHPTKPERQFDCAQGMMVFSFNF
jgi:hypothetical protein